STAVFRVSVANCSRCASCTDSACCSANSRSPRISSSGSPPKKGKPPSLMAPTPPAVPVQRDAVAGLDLGHELLHGRLRGLHRDGEGGRRGRVERLLQPARG